MILKTSKGDEAYGLTFTLGRGTNIVCSAVDSMKFLLENQSVDEIFRNFGAFWRKLTSESQLRWVRTRKTCKSLSQHFFSQLGPEKGVMHLACSAVINALWDLWGRLEGKPVWQLLTDMEPEVSESLN